VISYKYQPIIECVLLAFFLKFYNIQVIETIYGPQIFFLLIFTSETENRSLGFDSNLEVKKLSPFVKHASAGLFTVHSFEVAKI